MSKEMRLAFILTAALFFSVCASAQDAANFPMDSTKTAELAVADDTPAADAVNTASGKKKKGVWDRKKFMNLSYGMQTLTPDFGDEIPGKMSFAYVSGRNIYLHRKPIAGMIKFSIDLGADINYAQYGDLSGEYNMSSVMPEDSKGISGRHQLDVGLFVGPAISVNPVSDLKVSAYFRAVPAFSGILLDMTEINGAFVPYFTYGAEISWRWIGLGFECRTGSAGGYTNLMGAIQGLDCIKTGYSTSTMRFYLGLHF